MKQSLFVNLPIVSALVLWIIPVAYYGLTDLEPFWLPRPFLERTNVSRLFFKENEAWQVYEIQIRQKGSRKFESISEKDFFDWCPFGYRTRFQRIMSLANETRRHALADWLHLRLSANNQHAIAVRFISFPVFTPSSERAFGHYLQPHSKSVPQDAITIVSEYEFAP